MNIDQQSNSSADDPQATEDLQAGVIRAIFAAHTGEARPTEAAEHLPLSMQSTRPI